MLRATESTMPELSEGAQDDLLNCISLFMEDDHDQKDYKQSEMNLKNFLINYPAYKDHLIPKALSFFFEVFVHRQCENLDEKIHYFLEAIKNDANGKSSFSIDISIDDRNNGNVFVPYVLASALSGIRRNDKAADICKTYLDGTTTADSLWLNKFYFKTMIQLFDFDDQAKFALKLLQMDKSETNKFQVCIAIFLQAITKPLKKEREKGLEFSAKFAQKIFASDKPEYLKKYLEAVRKAQMIYADTPFLCSENEFIQNSDLLSITLPKDVAVEAFLKETTAAEDQGCEEGINNVIDYAAGSTLEEKYKDFERKLKTLKESPRSYKLWFDTFNVMRAIKAVDPKTDVFSTFASFFKFLQSRNNELERNDLISCIRFLIHVEHPEQYNLGSPAERMAEYVERYGHEFDENGVILGWYTKLPDEEKKYILEKTKKILGIFKKYYERYFEVGINNEVIDAITEIIEPKDFEAFGKASIPTDRCSLLFHYLHRLFLNDMMKYLLTKESDDKQAEKLVNKWIIRVDFLHSEKCAEFTDNIYCQSFFRQIVDTCITALIGIFKKFDHQMYLEVLTCFLKRHIGQAFYMDSKLFIRLCECQDNLGFANHFRDAIDNFLEWDPKSVMNIIFEHTGQFDAALSFYDYLFHQQRNAIQEAEEALTKSYSKGEIDNVIHLYENIDEMMNCLQVARYFSREEFLKSIILPSFSTFQDSFFKTAWPTELPITPENMDESEYLEAITEIKKIRILCHFLIIFNDYKKNDQKTAAAFDFCQDDLKYYLTILHGDVEKEKMNQPVITTSNMFENAVVQPFMKLINIYVKSIVTVFSHANRFVNGILQKLPNISKFRACVDEVSTILYNLFGQKYKNTHRIRATADAVKMATYMSRLIAVTYQVLVKYLNVKIEDFQKKKEYKAIHILFCQYAVELKLLMEIVVSLGQKWMGYLSMYPSHFVDEPSAATRHTVSTLHEFAQTRYSEYNEAFKAMFEYRHLPSLIEGGLLSKQIQDNPD